MPPRQFASSNQPATRALVVFGLGTLPLCTSGVLGQVDLYPVGVEPFDVAIADLNGDAWPDLVTANWGVTGREPSFSVLFNLGDGTFGEAETLAIGNGPYSVTAADFDGDRDLDLALGDTGQFLILFNDGTGHFGAPVEYPLYSQFISVEDVQAGDLDGDGDLDLITSQDEYMSSKGYQGQVFLQIYWNDGDGTFQDGPTLVITTREETGFANIALGDLDDDGDLDIASNNNWSNYNSYYNYSWGAHLVVFFNEDQGERWERIRSQNFDYGTVTRILAEDMDGDADADLAYLLITGWYPGPQDLFVAENLGDRSFSLESTNWNPDFSVADIAAGDLWGDGTIDLAALTSGQVPVSVRALSNLGDFTFEELHWEQNYGAEWAQSIALGDLNGDGMLEAVAIARRPEGSVLVFHNLIENDRPWLEQSPLVRGQVSDFHVTNAPPLKAVYFLYSLTGAGNSRGIPILGGMTIDLLNPVVLFGTAVSNEAGVAVHEAWIPSRAPLVPVSTQAVIRINANGEDSIKTHFITRMIVDQ